MLKILNTLADAGLTLRLRFDGKLVAATASGVIDTEIRRIIAENKDALVRLLSERVEQDDREAISRRAANTSPFASHAQRRLWFLEQFEPGKANYNMALAVRLKGEGVRREVLQEVFDALVERHEALRTTFRAEEGETYQVIGERLELAIELTDLGALQDEEREARVQELIRAEAVKPFDLEQGPLMRVGLLRLGEREHILLLTLHHIVADGWSMGVLINDIAQIYRGRARGEAAPLPPLPIQYADYAAWQRERLQGEHLQKQLAYWKGQLSGAPALLELPTDRPRPAVLTYRGASVGFALGKELTGKLHALAREKGVTLFMLLEAAFKVLLHRYSGQEDISVGTPIAGRNRVELEGLIGLFLNVLVLRSRIDRQGSFSALLEQAKETALQAYAHQELPFELLVEDLKPHRSLSHSPLFQVMFVLQNAPRERLEIPGLSFEWLNSQAQTTKFDLTCSLTEGQDRLYGRLEYSTDLFDRSTIERLAKHYEVLLEGICRDPQAKIEELPLLTEGEREQILVQWNQTQAPYPKDKAIHQLFEAQVRKSPQAVALVFESEQLSYAQLNERANRLAHYLRERGVGPEVLVGLCVERSVEMVVGLLGILKAGGAYVPLDPGYPAERLAYMLQDAAPKVLLTQERLLGRLPGLEQTQLFCLDRDWAQLAKGSGRNPKNLTGPEQLAYVIYTSGSTGTPKGVPNIHHAIVNRLSWMQSAYPIDARDRVLQKTPFSFDVSVWEFFWTLLYGARLVLAKPEGHKDAAYVAALICEQGITTAHFVPSMLEVFVDALAGGVALQSLRRVFCSGEALPLSLQQRFFRAMNPAVRLHNLYGPTEAAVDVTYWDCQAGGVGATVPIGRPIANTQIYILDEAMRPLPVGVAGELHIGGVGLARGYWRQEELTAQKFIANPFGELGSRLYKTGDLARYLPDGNIEYLGRLDHQVKLRGFRIELGEIESVLQQEAQVSQALVLLREDSPGDKRLVAYVVGKEGEPDVERLKQGLRAKLPEYMVPAAFVVLEALPLTPNGKLDRQALPAPDGSSQSAKEYVAPRTELEAKLAAIWAEVLKLDRVGVHDNFFELGGHSLLAITLIAQMQHRQIAADVRTLFTTRSLADLAAAIDRKGQSELVEVPANLIPAGAQSITPQMLTLVSLKQEEIDGIVKGVRGGAGNVQDIYPLAALQEGILFHHLMHQSGDPYVISTAMAFRTREQLQRVVDAMQWVIDRHDILRTAVLWEGLREPVQVVLRQATLPVEQVECDGSAGDIEKQLRTRFSQRNYRMDVRHAPLLRAFVARDPAKERWLLVVQYHHLANDHTTIEAIVDEARAYLEDRAETLPRPLPFRNFVAQARLGVSQAEHEAFFRKLLGDVREPTMPFGLLDVHIDGSQVGEHRQQLDAELARRLRERARVLGVSAAGLCHLAWARVLATLSGRNDVIFGTVLFGRMGGGQGIERALGMFINTLPIRVRIDEEDVESSVRRTHELLATLLRHEHAPLALAQHCSGVPTGLPLFTAVLNYRYAPPPRARAPASRSTGMRVLFSEERSNYPLTLSIDDRVDGFVLNAQIQTPHDPRYLCELMSTALDSLVSALEQTPKLAVRELQVLSQNAQHQLLVEWNQTEAPYPKDKAIHQLFEAQVRKSPQAVALLFEGEQLSYAQLNERANRLAHYLRERGVGPEVLVGLCVERSVEMVVGLLGILKAGGAYVPLDPGYPAERLAYMLQDAAPKVLLTQERLLGRLPELEQTQLFCLDRDWAQLAKRSSRNPKNLTGPEQLACLLYTSGSVGRPKGVMTAHDGICNLVRALQTTHGLCPLDTILQFASMTFDASVEEIFGALLSGCSLVLRSDEWLADAESFYRLCDKHGVTVANLPTAFWRVLSQFPGSRIPSRLRRVLVGGEAMSREDLRAWFRDGHGNRPALVNAYGPTEAAVDVTYWDCQAGGVGATVPIGRPIANTQIYILDEAMRPLPVGVAGELHIGGVGLARGYWRQEELTAQKFIANPFGELGSRLYKTGDLARYLPDGNIEYLGRLDHQVKLRGFRIELGEIESVLQQEAQVSQALVLLREDSPGDKRLVAYVVGKEGEPDVERLKQGLRAKLPEYMVPAAFVVLEALPLTPNGKLDRKALPAPSGERHSAKEYVAPRSPTEQTLARIWAQVLKIDSVGIHDNFFELGGHSLLAVRLVSRMRQAIGSEILLRSLFAYPTLHEVAALVDRQVNHPKHPCLVPIRPEGPLRPLFLIHPGEGEIGYARELAQWLDHRIPVYGLAACGFLEGEMPLENIPEMANLYLEAIRNVQPQGPYRLGGWSAGGTIAYEIAHRLSSLNEPVDFVGLIDTSVTPRTSRGERGNQTGHGNGQRLTEVDALLRWLRGRAPKNVAVELGRLAMNGDLDAMLTCCQRAGLLPQDVELPTLRRHLAVQRGIAQALRSYSPAVLSVRTTLFAATHRNSYDPTLGWAPLLRENLTVITIGGSHYSIVSKPYVQRLGDALSRALEAPVPRRGQ